MENLCTSIHSSTPCLYDKFSWVRRDGSQQYNRKDRCPRLWTLDLSDFVLVENLRLEKGRLVNLPTGEGDLCQSDCV